MKRDLMQQAYGAMRHDLRKTVLTMLGMAWGIATVVLLLAYGDGFARAIENIFHSFGATAVGIFPNRTSEQAGGNKAGVEIRFTNEDIELLRNTVPLVRHISRQSDKQSQVQYGNRSFSFPAWGVDPSLFDIWNLHVDEGRFLNDQDNLTHGLFAVLGSEAKEKLFSGRPALGEYIRIDGVSFQVIGVLQARMQEGDDDDNRIVYVPFNSMDALRDTHYLSGIWLDSEGLDHDKMTRTVRESLALAHNFKPTDERAVFIFDAQKQLEQFSIISMGLKILNGLHRNHYSGHRRHRADEHHAGIGHAANPGNRGGKGSGSPPERYPLSVSGRGSGYHCCGRTGGDSAVLHHFLFCRHVDSVQCARQARLRWRHPADCGAEDFAGGHHDSWVRGHSQWHVPGCPRRQPGSHRSLALRVTRSLVPPERTFRLPTLGTLRASRSAGTAVVFSPW